MAAAAPIAAALLLAGCGGSDGVEPRPQRPMTNAPEGSAAPGAGGQGGQAQAPGAEGTAARSTVALSGCVGTASGSSDLVLRSVHTVRGADDAHAQTTSTASESGITEGSWVRLDPGEHDQKLRQAAGQRVTLQGTIVDTGANTVGTSGAPGMTTPSGDKSQASATGKHHSEKVKAEAGPIARESIATGMAPLVRITALETTGEKCQEQTVRDGR